MEKNKNIGNHEERPLVTFFIMAYNQERYIREAVEGAFAQTYSPLEIILSDDCSTDRTFEIMKEMIDTYNGPHEIILNRNPHNLGIGAHVNRIMKLSHGELVVCAAGDDVSLPKRTEKNFHHWEASNRKATSISSLIVNIDEHGNTISGDTIRWSRSIFDDPCCERIERIINFIRFRKPNVFGCSHAWKRNIFTFFGPLPDDITNEDTAITFRSHLLGFMVPIPEQLVLYRFHSQNVSHRINVEQASFKVLQPDEHRVKLNLSRALILYNCYLRDTDTARAKDLLTEEQASAMITEIKRRIALIHIRSKFDKMSFVCKIAALCRIMLMPGAFCTFKSLAMRLIPSFALYGLRMFKHRLFIHRRM